MPLLTKKDFAARCGMPTNRLSVEITRCKVVIDEATGLIDTLQEKNVAFLQKWAPDNVEPAQTVQKPAKGPAKVAKAPALDVDSGQEPADENIITINLNEVPSYDISERLLKYLDTQKREREIEKLRLDIEKKRGEVVPVEPIGQLVFSFKQFVLTQQKLSYEKFLAEISHKYTITRDDMAYYRGFFIKALNDAIVEASAGFDRDLQSVLAEFTVKRGVGERGE